MPDPLISEQDLADYVARPAAASDPAATAAVDAASEVCRTIAEQVFNQVEDDVVVLNGTGTRKLNLPELPVIEVSEVTNGNDEALVADDDWVLSSDGMLYRVGGNWVKGDQNFTITYTHGYADEDLPRDVRMVALALAGRIYMQGPAVFESIGNRQVRYAGPAMDLSATENVILRKHNPNL